MIMQSGMTARSRKRPGCFKLPKALLWARAFTPQLADLIRIIAMQKHRRDERSHVLEGMSVAGLLHSLDYRLVDAKGDGDAEEGKQQVGDDADDAERCQREQQQHGQTKRQARLLGVPPVDQILNCTECRQISDSKRLLCKL